MRRGRLLLLLGFVLLLVAVIAFGLLSQSQPPVPTPAPGEATATPTPVIQTIKIVVAAQNIPRGRIITEDAVTLVDWPESSLPPGFFTTFDDVRNLIARTDILFNQPLTDVMLTNDRAQLTARGGDAALLNPNDKRSIALPIPHPRGSAGAIPPIHHGEDL